MRQRFFKWTAIISAVVLCAGCASTDPYTGERVRSNTKTLAIAGSVVGGVIGLVATKDLRGAAIGATIGGGLGTGTGYYQDRQEAALRQRIHATEIQLQRRGDVIQLTMPGDVTFATGSAHIGTAFASSLDPLVGVMNEYPGTSISVTGFTDRMGSFEANQILSEARASAVAKYLTDRGVAASRLTVAGMGPRNPIADNTSDRGRSKNRRVEITLTPTATIAAR